MKTTALKQTGTKRISALSSPSRSGKKLPAVSPLQRQLGNGKIAQLKVLANDKLNVVGEDHGESKQRRDSERNYCLEETGSGNYWTEEQLSVSGNPADPYNLRMLYMIKIAVQSLEPLMVEINRNQYLDHARECSRLVDNEFVSLALDNVNFNDLMLYSGLQTLGNDYVVPEQVRTDARQVYMDHQYILDACRKLKNDTTVPSEFGKRWDFEKYYELFDKGEIPARIAGMFNTVAQLVAPLRHIYNLQGLQTRDISVERSVVMHQGAQRVFNSPGVWKIGELHAFDMQVVPNKKYRLVSKDEFNTDYAQWLDKKSNDKCIIC